MPRIPHSTLLKAYKKSPLLLLVLRGSRTLPSAVNELRWITEHVEETFTSKCPRIKKQRLLHLCRRRSKAEPLQYVLGSQPFGEMDVKCRPGVLIPRPETEAYTTYLAHLITSHRLDRVLSRNLHPGGKVPFLSIPNRATKLKLKTPHIEVLDLCTGSGCIPLLLNNLVTKSHNGIQIYGWDISKVAVALARENMRHNVQLGHVKDSFQKHVGFEVVDIFDSIPNLQKALLKQSFQEVKYPIVNIIISNPPYISQEAFKKETARSVRNFEPKLALVPGVPQDYFNVWDRVGTVEAADVFYHRLLVLHSDAFQSNVLLMEVGDQAQAIRVARMAIDRCGTENLVEIWKDHPESEDLGNVRVGKVEVSVRGSGSFRAVALFRFGPKRP